jgi:hypothetical protein
MRLVDLEPRFLKILDSGCYRMVDALEEADGLDFLCPLCFTTNSGRVGTHHVICWRPHVPQTTNPIPGRWEFKGTGYGDLTLVAGSSSILLMSGCRWHGYITNGEVLTC